MTVENFLAWKKRFDETRAEARRKSKEAEAASLKGKLTGRQLFIRDSTLNDSDVKFLQEGKQMYLYLMKRIRSRYLHKPGRIVIFYVIIVYKKIEKCNRS